MGIEQGTIMDEIKKAQDRLDVLARIKDFESRGIFNAEVENDPPTIELKPNQIDYKRKKLINKIKRYFVFKKALKMLNQFKQAGAFKFDKIIGLENMQSVKTGAIVTSNHFNALDSFINELTFREANFKKKRLFRVIKEGNYTNSPAPFGPIMRNCNTLPLSSNGETMRKFLKCTNELIQEGNFVLIYPEEAMWWNYRKPRPLKNGAYRFAYKNNVPVIPCFITMEDSKDIGPDGFPIQIHTMHIEKPIYPNLTLDLKHGIEDMKEKNFACWKKIYEDTYKEELKY